MNRRSILLTLGLLVAGWLAFFGDKTPADDISEPVVRGAAGSASANSRARTSASRTADTAAKSSAASAPQSNGVTGASANGNGASSTVSRESNKRADAHPAVAILALQDRADLLGQSEALPPPPKGKKNTPLVADTLKPEPLFDSQTWNPPPPPPPKPTPPPPAVAPPLPYLVLGKKQEDQSWEVYLARGEQTFIAREKGTIENQYRVDSIKPPTMTLTYLPLNQVQTLTIGGTD